MCASEGGGAAPLRPEGGVWRGRQGGAVLSACGGGRGGTGHGTNS